MVRMIDGVSIATEICRVGMMCWVWATSPDNLPPIQVGTATTVRVMTTKTILVWTAKAICVQTAKMVRLGSRTLQIPNPLGLGFPNPDPYPSTLGFCRVWLDFSDPISCSVTWFFSVRSHLDILLRIANYSLWYAIVLLGWIRCLYI
jgi:hypothetical protein